LHLPNDTHASPYPLGFRPQSGPKNLIDRHPAFLSHKNPRYPTAKLAAKSHDLAAYYVRGEGAVTNFGIAAARDTWQKCPQNYSPVLQRSLQAAIERLQAIGSERGAIARFQAIGATGGAKAGTRQWHAHARAGFAGGPIEPIDAKAVTMRVLAATMAGAGPSPDFMRELLQAVRFGHPLNTPVCVQEPNRRCYPSRLSCSELHRITATTRVLVLAAVRRSIPPGQAEADR
jgi:hypothetical protein